jgi:hypothetical protein
VLSPEHRKLLVIDQGVVAFVINLVLNGGIGWLIFRSAAEVPVWGESSAGGDLLVTALLLPLLTAVIVSKLVAGQVESGKLPPLASHQIPDSGFSLRPSAIRGFALGGMAIVLAALPVVAALSLSASTGFASSDFIGFKAVWGGLLGASVSPVIAWWALADASRRKLG